ncbi:MAG TPA: hypothetical protein VG496_08950 [Myxococcales bacterium]|nr:hypothetical protein [Myxococcales bacterium]
MTIRFAVVLAAVLPASAMAQASSDVSGSRTTEGCTAPVLDGHQFMPSQLVDTPFRETTFKLGLLYGYGTATGPKYDVNGNVTGTADYTFAALGQTFRFEYKFNDWLSAGAVLLTTLYSGIDGPSAVSIGADISVGFGLRGRAGYRFGPVETAFILDVSNQPGYGILVIAPIIEAIQTGKIDSGSALRSSHTLTVNPSLAASWAPMPALGLTANAAYVYRDVSVAGTHIADQSGIQLGIVADFDFGKISTWPIGVSAGYRLTTPLGSGLDRLERVDDLSGGIFYTAFRNLGLGAEIGWRDFEIREPLDSKAVIVQIQLQYYW